MLKLATLSLAALLALASPAVAKTATAAPPETKAKCLAPAKFPDAIRVAGDDLKKFREAVAVGLPEQIDLVLLLKTAPVAVAFVKGCAVGYGVIQLPAPASATAPKSDDDGKI